MRLREVQLLHPSIFFASGFTHVLQYSICIIDRILEAKYDVCKLVQAVEGDFATPDYGTPGFATPGR
jgi:hypothetical protein